MNQTESLADEAGGLHNNSDFYVTPGSAVAVDASGVSITKSVTTSHQSCYPSLSDLGLRKQSLLVRFHGIQTRIITRIKLRGYCRCVYIQKAKNDGTFYSRLNTTSIEHIECYLFVFGLYLLPTCYIYIYIVFHIWATCGAYSIWYMDLCGKFSK